MPEPGKIVFFRTPAELRRWFRGNHAKAQELWVGYYKKDSGKASVTWPESVDEALCVGWIDGIRKSIDGHSYTIRFTPRRPGSIWSAVNIRRVDALTKGRRMQPAGLKAFAARTENKSGIYSYEQRKDTLEEPYAGLLKKNAAASAFFEKQPPSYRKNIWWWILSAKKEETRMARLRQLIEICEKGTRLR
ncbi:MAG TPA: YdeI/OmpD-associated family protein [Vicinamibacterales bacterium]|nr:YdeI/OmpD-associated family protein [Vicinamibacterales bacterium]